MSDEDLRAQRERWVGPAYRLFYERPVHFVRGEGVWLFDGEGNRYLDVYNNVPSVGHCHPHVVQAVARQLAQLNTHTRYLHPSLVEYSQRLLATFPAQLGQVMYACTGSEANDLALRVARTFTGGLGVIVTELAYHGVTDLVAGISPSLGSAVPRGAHVYAVPAPGGAPGTHDVGERFAAGVSDALEAMRLDGVKPAALIVDTMFSSDGVFANPAGFLAAAVAAVRAAGGVFIADEVQAGFGRTGDSLWGFGRHAVVPDLVTLGKPMGNGYPVAAMVARPEVLAPFAHRSRYFNTFGGTPAAMAAAGAVLDVIATEGLRENALDTGHYLRARLNDLASRHECVGEVRGAGLFVGVEVRERDTGKPDGALAARLVNALRERRVLISATGSHAHVLKIRPPLPFGRSDADVFVSALENCLAAPPGIDGQE